MTFSLWVGFWEFWQRYQLWSFNHFRWVSSNFFKSWDWTYAWIWRMTSWGLNFLALSGWVLLGTFFPWTFYRSLSPLHWTHSCSSAWAFPDVQRSSYNKSISAHWWSCSSPVMSSSTASCALPTPTFRIPYLPETISLTVTSFRRIWVTYLQCITLEAWCHCGCSVTSLCSCKACGLSLLPWKAVVSWEISFGASPYRCHARHAALIPPFIREVISVHTSSLHRLPHRSFLWDKGPWVQLWLQTRVWRHTFRFWRVVFCIWFLCSSGCGWWILPDGRFTPLRWYGGDVWNVRIKE